MNTKEFFLDKLEADENQIVSIVNDALHGADDGDLFLEYSHNQSLGLEDGKVKTTAYSDSSGMGLRRVRDEFSGLVHSNQMTLFQLKKAASELKNIATCGDGIKTMELEKANPPLYETINAVEANSLENRIKLMHKIDEYLRNKGDIIRQVMVKFNTNTQQIMLVRPEGNIITDYRPLVRMDVQVVIEKGSKMESGHFGFGTRSSDDLFFDESRWKEAANEAWRQAEVKINSIPAPAGEMPVVMGGGWSGVLFHEAVGHGLEGDFNRKGTSAFTGLIGQKVASSKVTLIDDGSIPNRRGSLTFDDEGTPTKRNVLIEDGILKGYMFDRMNARLMGMPLTGNGRRESYACTPLPRMTNTFLAAGTDDPAEIISSTKRGIYAKNFGGGQVDITSGNYVFEVSEAYLIEDGKITAPVKGATLIGNGPKTLPFIDMVGNDMELDRGIGTCGKDGQGVPVGVGQPTLRISEGITVGGTG